MKEFDLNLTLEKPIANLYRDRHVLIVCIDNNGNVILGDKPDFYPEGITRLVGGGMEKDDKDPRAAAAREFEEEMGFKKKPEDFQEVCEIRIVAKVESDSKDYKLITYVFKTKVNESEIKAGGDVASVTVLTLEQLKELADKYEALPGDLSFHHKSGYSHLWRDYGRVYGPIHRIVYEQLMASENK